MKIAVVCSGHIPSHYAHSINTVKHANAFAKLGHDVELLTVERYQEAKFNQEIDSIFDWYGIDKLIIKFFKDNSPFYWHEKIPYTRLLNAFNKFTFKKIKKIFDPEKNISKYIKDNSFDICFARSYNVVKHNVKNNIATIMETHNNKPENSQELLDVIKLSKSKYFLGIVTIHNTLKDNFIRLGVEEKKILVLDDAVDLEQYDKVSNNIIKNRKELNISIDKKIVLYCGSLKAGKGIHVILETAKKLQYRKDVLFYIVGGNIDEVKRWKSYCDKKQQNIIFTGFIEGSETPTYLKSADILFMPYDITEKYMVMDINTTSPIKLFEYMAAKKPIVTTRIEVIEKILKNKESGILVNDDNYVKAIEELILDNVVSKKMSDNAYKDVSKFTYKMRCKTIIKELS
jgi:glycosyltransferase involved in cell wall biosynthesis